MNPYQTPRESSPGLLEGYSSADDRVRRFTGGYYRALGWLGVATMVVSIATAYWTDYLHFDLSFLIWFWLGNCLKMGKPTARKWAIAFFLLVTVFSLLAPVLPNVTANFGESRFDRTQPAFYGIMATMWLVFAIPGIVLLSRRGKAAFKNKKIGEQVAAPNRLTRSESDFSRD